MKKIMLNLCASVILFSAQTTSAQIDETELYKGSTGDGTSYAAVYDVQIYNSTEQSYYADKDGDGFGDVGNKITACYAELGFVTDSTDCDDTDAQIHPGANEVCNGFDDNCNLVIDESPLDTIVATPVSAVLCTGDTLTLFAAEGEGYNYSWFKNDSLLEGEISATLMVNTPGLYYYTIQVNAYCLFTSGIITVTGSMPPDASIQYSYGGDLCVNNFVLLKVEKLETNTYQWYKNDEILVHATRASYKATSVGTYFVKVTNAEGCTVDSEPVTVFNSCRLAEDAANETQAVVYPNPADAYVNISVNAFYNGSDAIQCNIYNTTGQKLHTVYCNAENKYVQNINLENFSAGLYIVKIYNASGDILESTEFIKK